MGDAQGWFISPAVPGVGPCREGMQRSLLPSSIPSPALELPTFTDLGDMAMATEKISEWECFHLDLGIFTFPLYPVTPLSCCAISPISRAEQKLCHYSFVPKCFYLCYFFLQKMFWASAFCKKLTKK